MNNFFSKPLDQINTGDIHSLRDMPEGQVFEIKADLSGDKNKIDPWYNQPTQGKVRKGPGNSAKQSIFKELVAFANAEGGWLVLGLTETKAQPKRVKDVIRIPDCHELAERFERAAQDWIDPPLPSLRCVGVPIGKNSNDGVLVFRVPRFAIAPHRLYKKGLSQEAYKRMGDESKPMRMREIQDLTIDIARGQERIDTSFNYSKKRFLKFRPERGSKRGMVGFRITSVPISGPNVIDRPYLHVRLFERKYTIHGQNENGGRLSLETIDQQHMSRTKSGVRPILRGGQRMWSCSYEDNEDLCAVEIFESGIINFIAKSTNTDPPNLSSNWILADLANVLWITENSRITSGNIGTEYALEIELQHIVYGDPSTKKIQNRKFNLGLFEHKGGTFPFSIGPEPLLLPRYRIGPSDEFPNILKTVMDDLYNLVGLMHDNFLFDQIT